MAPKSPWNKKGTINTTAEQTASPAINYGEVQSDEIEVLQAIYMEDYMHDEAESKSAWGKAADRSFKLKLRSFSDSGSFVILTVRFTATYPKTAPLLEIAGLDSYHERTEKRVLNVVQRRPVQMLGEAMIHTIASEIQEALEDAVSARQRGTLPSLEEERESAQEVANALARNAEEAEARRRHEEQAEQDRVLKQKVDEEVIRREKRKSFKVSPASVTQPSPGGEDVVSFDQPARLLIGNEFVEFSSVTVIGSLSQKLDDELYLGRPLVAEASAHSLVAVKKITSDKSRDEIMQIETMLEAVRKLSKPAVLGLLAFRVDRVDNAVSRIVLCSEYADRGTLHDLLELGEVHVDKARQFTVDLLEALDYLHSNGVVHGMLTVSSVFLHSTPSLSLRLGQLGQWAIQTPKSPLPQKWQAPEDGGTPGALTRKSDIWSLGIVIMQMFLGLQIVDEYASPHVMMSRLKFSHAFDDFARKLFATDVKKRPSAFDLLPVEFLRTDLPIMKQSPAAHVIGPRASSPGKRRSRHNSSSLTEQTSRYTSDFTEIGRLGKGGYGEVVKARNKLDSGVYAVKKVKQSSQLLDQVLSEVMLLNRLNHPYVVRYYSTWVEPDPSSVIEEEAATTEESTNDNSSDGSRMDFGYQSNGGLDFVSNSGLPQIEFGDDDDEVTSEEDTTEDVDEQPFANGSSTDDGAEVSAIGSLRLSQPRQTARRLPSILYIQMELCERRTLRDLLRKGLGQDDVWRYVRQITEGLAHIHGHGIIHRDLKPDNIFLDVAGSPKIGDFGLATTGQYQPTQRATTSGQSTSGDMTRSVGTALYVAPELRSGSKSSYNDKVDMYSLGIMFFEMCEEFTTTFERIKSIQEIRNEDHCLPPAYQATGAKAAEGRLIDCLISHKPSDRLNSTQLLRSDMLPVKVEDEAIRQALAGLHDPHSPYHQKMMSALFAHDASGSDRVRALAWDAKGSQTVEQASRTRLRAVARGSLLSVFRRHGAEETRRPTVFPRSGYYTNTNVVQLLDASGSLVQLPYDLTLPHARELAQRTPAVKRTYTFGSAFRDDSTGGPPKASEEVDFDIAMSGENDNPTFDDAEVLKVVDDITCQIPTYSTSPSISIHINHASILDSVLEICRVPKSQNAVVQEIISKLGFHQYTWAKVRADMRKIGLPDTSLDDLQQFDFREPPMKAFPKLLSLFSSAPALVKARLDCGIKALQAIIEIAALLSVQRDVLISPLGSVNAKFYDDGMLFQCVLERKATRVVIAAGGRYDSLIRAHRGINVSSSATPCPGAVGVCIGLDPIVAHMAKSAAPKSRRDSLLKDRRSAPDMRSPKRCDILVEVGTPGARVTALKILSTLWASDISAELAVEGTSMSGEHHSTVVVRHEASSTVRVSKDSPDGVEETDVPITSLISYLQQELRERDNNKPPAFVRQTSHHDPERKGNVQVLMAQHRSKKSNKYHIVDAAQHRWSDMIEGWKDAPILAVESRDDAIETIRETRLSDTESWRKAVQGAQLSERQYLGQIQDILSAWRKKWIEGDGTREACIYNFRTGQCVYYDLGL